MKKPIFFIILMFLVVIIFFVGLLTIKNNQKNLEKVKLENIKGDITNFDKLYDIKALERDNTCFHLETKHTSCKANYFRIGQEKIIPLNSKLKGKVLIHFNVRKLNIQNNSIFLKLEKKSKSTVMTLYKVKIPPANQIHTVHKNIILKDGEYIFLKFIGNGDILLTPPIIYRDEKNKKLIFLISIDTLRSDHLSVYGYPKNVDPNITEFAKDCAIFKNCFAQTSWTLPSHVSLFTGLHMYNHEVFNKHHKIPDKIQLINEYLYQDYLNISYNGGIYVSYKYGFYKGFDFYTSLGGRQSSKKIFEKTIKVLENTKTPNLFAFLHTYQVHSPYNLHRELPLSQNILKQKLKSTLSLRDLTGGRNGLYKPLEPDIKNKIIDYYDAEYEYFDHWFGYFIQNLKRLKLYDKSMIIILSDHGEEFFEHKAWGHGYSLYNEVIHVPLLIKFPNNRYAGQTVTANVGLIDVFPTICDFFKIKIPQKIDGQSLLKFFNIKGRGDRKIISVLKFETDKNKQSEITEKIAIVYKHFKIIYNFKYNNKILEFYSKYPPPEYIQYEFYDIENDFREKNNLAFQAKHRKIFEYLKKDIKKIISKIYSSHKKRKLLKYKEQEIKKLKELGYL